MIGDTPKRDVPRTSCTADWTFLRFHHGTRGRNGNYSERELEEWARRIEAWAAEREVFAYFNNDWNGYAVRNGSLAAPPAWASRATLRPWSRSANRS